MLICEKAFYNKADRTKIYCSESNELCAHQYWCDMACRWKNTNQAEKCPGKNTKKKTKKTK